jgi:ABC-type antimicrobial peptide transport system permease subunit
VRKAVWSVDKDQPVWKVRTLQSLIDISIGPRRFMMWLLAGMSALALLLASVGLYGVMSYTVTQRTHEIGIRVALGAQAIDVLKLIVRSGMTLVLAGIVIGLAGAFGLTRLMSTLLFGVTPTDVTTFAGVSVALILVALLACYLPARRAMKVDPLVALRYE